MTTAYVIDLRRPALRTAPRPPAPASPGPLADLWRSAPADIRHDTIALFALIPVFLTAFALAWVMLPS